MRHPPHCFDYPQLPDTHVRGPSEREIFDEPLSVCKGQLWSLLIRYFVERLLLSILFLETWREASRVSSVSASASQSRAQCCAREFAFQILFVGRLFLPKVHSCHADSLTLGDRSCTTAAGRVLRRVQSPLRLAHCCSRLLDGALWFWQDGKPVEAAGVRGQGAGGVFRGEPRSRAAHLCSPQYAGRSARRREGVRP